MKNFFTFLKNYWFDIFDIIGMFFITSCLLVGFGLIENPLWSWLSLFGCIVLLFCWMKKNLLQSEVKYQKEMGNIYKDYAQKLNEIMNSNNQRMDNAYNLVESTMHTITDIYSRFSNIATEQNKFTSDACTLNAERYQEIIKILTLMNEVQIVNNE